MTTTLLATPAERIDVRQPFDKTDRPRPEWVRGICPQCGEQLVSNCYYVGGKGYLIVWECWSSRSDNPACTYRRVL